MSEHALGKLPTIGLSNTEPGLHEHALVKLEVAYPCTCGETVRTSYIGPEADVKDATAFSYHVQDVGRRARERGGQHLRGEA